MSIQESGPEFRADDHRNEPLEPQARGGHLTLVPNAVDDMSVLGQPHEGLITPKPLTQRQMRDALYIGTTAAGDCYSAPRGPAGRYRPD